MHSLLGRTVGATLVCLIYYFVANKLMLGLAWPFLAVVIGLAFNRIVIDVVAEASWRLRTAALEGFSGTHYKFQNFTVNVIEDADHCRWVSTDEVRKIVGQLASDYALAQLYPVGHQLMGKGQKGHLRDDALIAHLAQATTPQAIKFKNWAERNISYPARTNRQRLGITVPAATNELDR